jgi:peptidoglycan/LPS O-acetylase OafA/YrhL
MADTQLAPRGTATATGPSRLTSVDGVRGAAIFMVVVGHLIGFPGLLTTSSVYATFFGSPAHVLWDETAAVQIFFVLSGFVLQLGQRQHVSSAAAYRFLIARFFRLYPLYGVALLFAFGCRRLWAGHDHLIAFNPELAIFWNQAVGWSELLNHLVPLFPTATGSNLNPVLWSIFVEFKFSLMFPLIAVCVAYTEKRTVPFWLMLAGSLVYSATSSSESTGRFLFHFVLGAALANTAPIWTAARRTPWNLMGAAFAVWLLELRYAPYAPHLDQTHYDLLCAIGGGILLCCVVRSPALDRIFSAPIMVWLGRRTYGIYLFHFPILLVAITWAMRWFPSNRLAAWTITTIATIPLACTLGALGYRWIELPGNAFGKSLAAAIAPLRHDRH